MDKIKILILDDETRLIDEIREYLETAGHTVYAADKPSRAFHILKGNEPDIAIVDIKLPEYDGLEFIRRLNSSYPEIETIVMSGHGDMNNVIEAFRLGAFDYLKKPFTSFELQASIGRTGKYLKVLREREQYAWLCSSLNGQMAGKGELIGESPPMQELKTAILSAAGASLSVLVSGESGTGKELVARRIHMLSERRDKPFVAVNCAAVPRDMFESEFFGHDRGAFTGAAAARTGHFRTADGGCLFLDEVGELPVELQAKLLRVIEDGKVRPVGSDREISVDVRIICATNRPLSEAVECGSFRQDLYYRIAVIDIIVPPLRERIADVEALARHFLHTVHPSTGRNRELSPRFLKRLKEYPFPGNVRELRNLVERALIVGSDPVDLNFCDDALCSANRSPMSSFADRAVFRDGSGFNLDIIECETIRSALAHSGGVLSHAAELLGITRQALNRRLEKYEM